jgi:hypothetical protein
LFGVFNAIFLQSLWLIVEEAVNSAERVLFLINENAVGV